MFARTQFHAKRSWVTTGISANRPWRAFLAFPYLFPGAYTQPQQLTADQYGWIHSPSPYANVAGAGVSFESNPIGYLQSLNHNPLDLADNLPTPTTPIITAGSDRDADAADLVGISDLA